jgi:hypothetical protein
MKTNRQSLHAANPFAFANHISAPALRTEVKLLQRLDCHKHPALSNLRLGGTIAFGYTKDLVQQ